MLTRDLSPVFLQQLALDVPLLVDQTSLDNRIRKELQKSTPQRIATVEHRKKTVPAFESTLNEPTQQTSANLRVFAVPEIEIQYLLSPLSVDP